MNKGILYAVLAYGAWGLLPLYWKLLQDVPAFEILCHRIVWSLLFLLLILAVRRHWQHPGIALRNGRIMLLLLLTALILSVNWVTYIWAVNVERVVETSLGYFINPLVNVVFGVLFLRERLRGGQWLAVAIATCGVLALTFIYGQLPWVALTLAGSFGIYGLLRKIAAVDATSGLAVETAWLSLPALAVLIYLELNGSGSFGHRDWLSSVVLAGAGVATALPLLWFGMAARRITLTSIGILQYIAPSTQFLLGVLLFREPFSQAQFFGFALIWSALLIYSGESLLHRRARLAAGGA